MAHAESFTVRKGDTLSEIARTFMGKPIYGKRGSLRKIIALNPQIKNPNFIRPGQIVYIDQQTEVAEVEPVSAPAQTSVNTEDTFEVEPVIELIAPREIAAPEVAEFSPRSRLGVSTGFEYFAINATDKATKDDAKLISTTTPLINTYWELQWSEKYSSRLNIGYAAEVLVKDKNTDKKLKNASGVRTNFGLDITRKMSEKFRIRALAAYSRRAFLKAESQNVVRLDRINGLEVGGGFDYDFIQRGNAAFGIGLQATLLAPARGPGYSTETGYASLANLYFRHQLRSAMLEANTYYGYWDQQTKYVSQNVNSVGVNVGLAWSFDE